MQIGLIGFGAIGQDITERLQQAYGEDSSVKVAAVLLRSDSGNRLAAEQIGVPVIQHASQFAPLGVEWVIECAGHAALQRHGADVLSQGIHLLAASVGALADDILLESLKRACQKGARLMMPSGALGGLDALASARHSKPLHVTYISEKPVSAWRGTAAATMIDLDAVTGNELFFNGTARQAALQFPQNANVAAAVAFAGVGLDSTLVQLHAVAGQTVNRHQLIAHGAFGRIHSTVEGEPLARNPKTSVLAATSLLEATLNQQRTFKFA
jgi:aspartate dehydrogenase